MGTFIRNGIPYGGSTDIDAVHWEDQSILGAKNLLHYPYVQTTRTSSGVTITDNGDGTLTLNGTQDGTTNRPYFGCGQWWETDKTKSNYHLKEGNAVIVSINSSDNNVGFDILVYQSDGTRVEIKYGQGLDEVEVGGYSTDVYLAIGVTAKAEGEVISNVKVYPMIRLASDTDNTYVPYAMTNRELTVKMPASDTVLSANLAANATSLSFTNALISQNKRIDVHSSVYGVNPTNMTVSSTTLTLTFPSSHVAATIYLTIRG